jgi:hypothetical protein
MPFNLFDVLLVLVLLGGIFHGRKHGFSEEMLCSIKWLVVLFGCATLYQPTGTAIAESGAFDLLSGYIIAYLGLALAIFLIFSFVERRLAPKLLGSDIFGRGEYFLGMGSGMLRYACILLVGLSLLNARAFSPTELTAMSRSEVDTYGSHVFPNLHSLQVAVFEKSLTGCWIKGGLGFLLISPTSTRQQAQ